MLFGYHFVIWYNLFVSDCELHHMQDETEFSPPCGEGTDIIVCGFAKASEESKKAIHAARMFRPKNPSFMVLLRSYNKCFVVIS